MKVYLVWSSLCTGWKTWINEFDVREDAEQFITSKLKDDPHFRPWAYTVIEGQELKIDLSGSGIRLASLPKTWPP